MDEKVKDPNVRIANFLGYIFYPWNNTEGRSHGWQKYEYNPYYSKEPDLYLCKHKNELCFSSNIDRTRLILDKLRRIGFNFSIQCMHNQFIFNIDDIYTTNFFLSVAVYEGALKLLDKYGDDKWPEPKNKQPWHND